MLLFVLNIESPFPRPLNMASNKGLTVSIGWYLGFLNGQLGGAGFGVRLQRGVPSFRVHGRRSCFFRNSHMGLCLPTA